jgi:hypothetical protein
MLGYIATRTPVRLILDVDTRTLHVVTRISRLPGYLNTRTLVVQIPYMSGYLLILIPVAQTPYGSILAYLYTS